MSSVIQHVRQELAERRFKRGMAGKDPQLHDISDKYTPSGAVRAVRALGRTSQDETTVSKSGRHHSESTHKSAAHQVEFIQVQLLNDSTFLYDADAKVVYGTRPGPDGKPQRLVVPKTELVVGERGNVHFFDHDDDFAKPIVHQSVEGNEVSVQVYPPRFRDDGLRLRRTYLVPAVGSPSATFENSESDHYSRRTVAAQIRPDGALTAQYDNKYRPDVVTTFADEPSVPLDWLKITTPLPAVAARVPAAAPAVPVRLAQPATPPPAPTGLDPKDCLNAAEARKLAHELLELADKKERVEHPPQVEKSGSDLKIAGINVPVNPLADASQ